MNVLVIDDSPTVRADLRAVLSGAGFGVISCDTKAAARQVFGRSSFAAVILDVNLPDGDGIALLEEMKQTPALNHVPILLLSSESAARTRIRGMARGAHEYVNKPYDRAYLVRRIKELSRSTAPEVGARVARSPVDQRILLVDGGAGHRDAMLSHLRADGHEIVVARSGEEAIEFLAADDFAGVILDVDRMGPAGGDLCRQIKALPRGQQIHVIILTAKEDRDAERAFRSAGADEVVLKTLSFGLLRIRLRFLLHNIRRKASAGAQAIAVAAKR